MHCYWGCHSPFDILWTHWHAIPSPSARLMWTFFKISNGTGGLSKVSSVCFMKQYFQNVGGYPVGPKGYKGQWRGTFVHGAVARNVAVFEYCMHFEWYRQFEVFVLFCIMSWPSWVLHPPPHQPHRSAQTRICQVGLLTKQHRFELNLPRHQHLWHQEVLCEREEYASQRVFSTSHGAKGHCFSTEFTPY